MVDTVEIMQWILHGEMAHLSSHFDVELCEITIKTSLLLDLREDKGHTKTIVRGSGGEEGKGGREGERERERERRERGGEGGRESRNRNQME